MTIDHTGRTVGYVHYDETWEAQGLAAKQVRAIESLGRLGKGAGKGDC